MANEIRLIEHMRSMKNEIKAPRRLVNAAKCGERITPVRKTDTNATHIRRFSKAFAVYACVAALLICGSLALPALLREPATPLSQPNEEVPPTETFVRSDLVWADETNELSKISIFSWFEDHTLETEECEAGYWFELPDYPEDTVYAVEANVYDLQFIYGSNEWTTTTPEPIAEFLTESEGWESFEGPNGQLCFAVTKAQIEALDTEALFNVLTETCENLIAYDGDTAFTHTHVGGEFHLSIAWQSSTDAPPIATQPATEWNRVYDRH